MFQILRAVVSFFVANLNWIHVKIISPYITFPVWKVTGKHVYRAYEKYLNNEDQYIPDEISAPFTWYEVTVGHSVILGVAFLVAKYFLLPVLMEMD